MYKDWYRIPVLHYGLECVGHSVANVAHFFERERCLDSSSETCRSEQARYQLSHPSPFFVFFLNFLACWPLLCLCRPFMSGFEPRELLQEAGSILTQPPTSMTQPATHLPDLATHLPNLANHLPTQPPISLKNYMQYCITIMKITQYRYLGSMY